MSKCNNLLLGRVDVEAGGLQSPRSGQMAPTLRPETSVSVTLDSLLALVTIQSVPELCGFYLWLYLQPVSFPVFIITSLAHITFNSHLDIKTTYARISLLPVVYKPLSTQENTSLITFIKCLDVPGTVETTSLI